MKGTEPSRCSEVCHSCMPSVQQVLQQVDKPVDMQAESADKPVRAVGIQAGEPERERADCMRAEPVRAEEP